ncbi:hypothetical protein GCM10010468_75070 [Actinocorallia longicatena]|uniref:Uncharacterized protein n=1 Tax=Actinocorallia longicatena TaxID=111803 RepID=A0ABP6QL04_9ACTN
MWDFQRPTWHSAASAWCSSSQERNASVLVKKIGSMERCLRLVGISATVTPIEQGGYDDSEDGRRAPPGSPSGRPARGTRREGLRPA